MTITFAGLLGIRTQGRVADAEVTIVEGGATCPSTASFAEAVEALFQDTCKIATGSESGDFSKDPGDESAPSDFGDAISCGFRYTKTWEKGDGQQTPIIDAVLRVSLSQKTVVNSSSRIQLTHRHGNALTTALIFSIIGSPNVGETCVICNLKYAGPGGAV